MGALETEWREREAGRAAQAAVREGELAMLEAAARKVRAPRNKGVSRLKCDHIRHHVAPEIRIRAGCNLCCNLCKDTGGLSVCSSLWRVRPEADAKLDWSPCFFAGFSRSECGRAMYLVLITTGC